MFIHGLSSCRYESEIDDAQLSFTRVKDFLHTFLRNACILCELFTFLLLSFAYDVCNTWKSLIFAPADSSLRLEERLRDDRALWDQKVPSGRISRTEQADAHQDSYPRWRTETTSKCDREKLMFDSINEYIVANDTLN